MTFLVPQTCLRVVLSFSGKDLPICRNIWQGAEAGVSCTRSWLQLVWWQLLVCWQLLVLVLEATSCKHKRAHKPKLALRELANTKVYRCSPAI